MKALDLSDYDWTQLPVSYDEDDRLHTHLGLADMTVDFSAQRIGLKVRKMAANTVTVTRLTKYQSIFSASGDPK